MPPNLRDEVSWLRSFIIYILVEKRIKEAIAASNNKQVAPVSAANGNSRNSFQNLFKFICSPRQWSCVKKNERDEKEEVP